MRTGGSARARRLGVVLAGVALAAFGALADRALVAQSRIAQERARAELEDAAHQSALAVRATLARVEEEAAAGRDATPAEAWRVARPPRAGLSGAAWAPVDVTDRAALAQALSSRAATASGLPLAVVASVALGEPESRPDVREALLEGRLPVRAEDLPRLAEIVGGGGDPRVERLAARLRSVPPDALPSLPAFRRDVGDGRVVGWARDAVDVVYYSVDIHDLLAASALGPRAAWAGPMAPPGAWRIAVPGVERLELDVAPATGEVRRVRAQRVALWAAVAAAVAALAGLARALGREAAALARERAFIAGVTHELRTPVAALRLFGETLADGRGEPREYGALIARESERLEALAERALTAARVVEAPELEPVDAAALAGEAVALAAPRARDAGKSLDVVASADLPACTWDADAVARALANLVDNALRHGGARITVEAAGRGDSVVLTVRDDGPGIRRRDRRGVFEPFRRGRRGGTGLGLYLVEQVARAHGGTVELESEEGRGCAFALVLPARPPAAAAPRRAPVTGRAPA